MVCKIKKRKMYTKASFGLRVGYLVFNSILLIIMIQLVFKTMIVFIHGYFYKKNMNKIVKGIELNTNTNTKDGTSTNTDTSQVTTTNTDDISPSVTVTVKDVNKSLPDNDKKIAKLPHCFRVIIY